VVASSPETMEVLSLVGPDVFELLAVITHSDLPGLCMPHP